MANNAKSRHILYEATKPTWFQTRSAYLGQPVINDNLSTFVPPRSATTTRDSRIEEARQTLAKTAWVPHTSRSGKSVLGALNFGELTTTNLIPNSIYNNIDLSGNNFALWLSNVIESELQTGSDAIEVSLWGSNAEEISLNRNLLGVRPYLIHWAAENIIDWVDLDENSAINGFKTVWLRYKKELLSNEIDPYNINSAIEYIVKLSLDDNGYYYRQNFTSQNGSENIDGLTAISAPFYPEIKGQKLTELPFRRLNSKLDPQPSFLQDTANLNFELLNATIAQKYAIHIEQNKSLLILDPNDKVPSDFKLGDSIKVNDPDVVISTIELGDSASGITDRRVDYVQGLLHDISGLPRLDNPNVESYQTLALKDNIRNTILKDFIQKWNQQIKKGLIDVAYYLVDNNQSKEQLMNSVEFSFEPNFIDSNALIGQTPIQPNSSNTNN